MKGRTRVRVVVAQETASYSTPRFVLSPYRSGTTLLRYCLDSHPELAVPPETDYLAHLADIVTEDASARGLMDLGYASDDMRRQVANFGRQFLDTYAHGKNKANWVDKSPRYAEDPASIRALYPDAKYVVMHRHPLDQIFSFTKGGKYTPVALRGQEWSSDRELVLGAARYWSDVTNGLQKFVDSSDGAAVKVRYEDLCDSPRRVLGDIVAHLDVAWNDAVLRYHEHDHDLGREAGRVQGTIGFSRSEGAWRSWPDELIKEVWRTVEGCASELDYSVSLE